MTQQDNTTQERFYTTVQSFSTEMQTFRGSADLFGLSGSAAGRFLAPLLHSGQPPLLFLATDLPQARRLQQELQFFSSRPETIYLFPNWEVSPYDPLTPHRDIEAMRLETLLALRRGRVEAVVTTPTAAMQRVIPAAALDVLSTELVLEEEYARDILRRRLFDLGYRDVALVEDMGTFSLRGDILDLYIPTCAKPIRIDFYGDFIESMRYFDPETQRSSEEGPTRLDLVPAQEMVLAGEYLELFSQQLKERCDALGLPRTTREAVLEEVREGLLAPGRNFLLPLNYSGLDTLFDYVNPQTVIHLDPPEIDRAADDFSSQISAGAQRVAAGTQPFAEPHQLYLSIHELEAALAAPRVINVRSLQVYDLDTEHDVFRVNCRSNGGFVEAGAEKRLDLLCRQIKQWLNDNWYVELVCHKEGQARRLSDLLRPRGVELKPWQEGASAKGAALLRIADLTRGFQLPDEQVAIITEEEIFGARNRRRGKEGARAKAALSSLAQLHEGDYVVHADHGVGIYRGLEQVRSGNIEGDFLQLEYAGGDKLYLPIERIEKVQKYADATGQHVKLDKMGGQGWAKTCQRARIAVEEMARELLNIYARRKMRKGRPFSPPDEIFRAFEAAFPYEETPDQMAAIQDVLTDMQSDIPMDRLICGDVGYGKTEVAIRATFKAVLDSRQVAVVVPTTILARQHYSTFCERFSGYPVNIKMVSRFCTPAQNRTTLEEVKAGKIDVVIGTHRLIQRDVHFKDLGLVVIDEEQRFGVKHKEHLKKMRAEVAMLTLSATPIPRTLNMGMLGLRDLSVIDTPPVDRLAIRTYVTRFDDDLIREAIMRELKRGGQVYFVHNRVKSIGAMTEFVQNLVPEAKVATGHGQMAEKDLEQVLISFIEGETQVLVTSTIIENGLDIPRANTIIINRADCFGLAQLYQIRGRVGRSKERGYAYLLIPGETTLTRDARARLQVLQDQTELGAGFRVASHDLEIRGAGDLLGGRQAGQIAAIGFEMYSELLEETIQELKGAEKQGRIDPEIRLGLTAFLPDTYVEDPNQRLVFYKKMAAAADDAELYDIVDELQDRYGSLPQPGQILLEMMKLRIDLKRLRIDLAEHDGRALVFGFHPTTTVSPDKLLHLIQHNPKIYSLAPDYRLRIVMQRAADLEMIEEARKQLQNFN
ncbi:MAG: transcription-repair coupling factor [Desulfuromonadaceae bacterium]|nr:transcription-repair coupling factor [Desulfuromonadaceae bacterium]